MDLSKAVLFADNKLKTNKSDGCTLAPDLGIGHWCRRHDMWRRFEYETPWNRDAYFFKGIWSEGIIYTPIAVIYWLGVVIPRKLGFTQ